MQNFKNLDVFEILITQKLLKCPKDPFVRSALIWKNIDVKTIDMERTYVYIKFIKYVF